MDRTTLIDFFEEVETTEECNGYFCSIAEAIGIVVLGSLCGFRNVRQIHHWAENARVKEFLKEKFQIAHIPCYFWLLTLLKMVKPNTLNECMMKWASQFMPEDRNGTTISLDGKTIRSTVGRKSMDSPLHIISAQICEIGVTLASEAVEGKSNEIPAVQELLKKMDIEGCLIVADALNCQQKTAEAIIAGKADYLLDVKANQRNLEEEIAEYIKDDELRGSMDKKRTVEKNRERIEIRTAYTSDDAAWLCGREKWKNLCCIGAIRKEVEADGKRTEEWDYYISSRKLPASALSEPSTLLPTGLSYKDYSSWQARSFGAKRQQAETLTSPRLLLDGAFPIPPATQISSVAARCAIAIFPRAAARWSAGSVRPAPADRRRSPCGSEAPASAPAPGGTRRRPPFSLPAALQILRSGS